MRAINACCRRTGGTLNSSARMMPILRPGITAPFADTPSWRRIPGCIKRAACTNAGSAFSAFNVMQQRCFVLIAMGISRGTIAQRPQVPIIVISTSPGWTVKRRRARYFSSVIKRRSSHENSFLTALSIPRTANPVVDELRMEKFAAKGTSSHILGKITYALHWP